MTAWEWTPAERAEILRLLDSVVRSRRGAALVNANGEPSNLGIIWMQEIAKAPDPEIATRAVALLFTETQNPGSVPTPAEFKAAWRKLQRDAQPARPALEEGSRRELPAWVKGWLVARAAGDTRVWPQQKAGYDELQYENPYQRTYVWNEQEQVPDDERRRLERQGETLTSKHLAALFAGAVGK